MYGDNMLEEDVTEKSEQIHKSIVKCCKSSIYKPDLKHKSSL